MLVSSLFILNKKLLTSLGLSEKSIKGANIYRKYVPWILVLCHSRGSDNLVEVLRVVHAEGRDS